MEPFGYANATTEGYVNANGDWPTARVNFPIIRFAEMMLFRAEAYLMKNQPDKAWKDLNRIHVRACGLLYHHQLQWNSCIMNVVVN